MAIEEVTLPLTVAANHFRPWTSRAATVVFSPHRQEAVGGKLTIGRDELTFQPHQFNLQTDIKKWPTAAIEGFEPTNTLGLIPNGIVIHFRNAPSERFVVAKRKQVLTILNQVLTELQHLRQIVDYFRPAPSSPEQRAAELTKEHEQDIVGSLDDGLWRLEPNVREPRRAC